MAACKTAARILGNLEKRGWRKLNKYQEDNASAKTKKFLKVSSISIKIDLATTMINTKEITN